MGIQGPTVPDLRRTVSTNMTSERCGLTPFIRSKGLGLWTWKSAGASNDEQALAVTRYVRSVTPPGNCLTSRRSSC